MAEDLISIVVPCYNEFASIPYILERIDRSLREVADIDYEIVIVDDGSCDDTPEILEICQKTNPHLAVIRFVRNFGHQAALSAGLTHARGSAVICMDGDLQHPPELLPELIGRWREGFDVVQTIRRSQPGLTKSVTSRLFYMVLNLFSEVRVEDGAADFRLMSRRAVDSLLAMPEQSRFLRGLVAWLGFPCTTIEFEAPPRRAGTSAYNFRTMLRFATEALVALSTRPLNIALWVAALTMVAASGYLLYIFNLMAHGVPVVKGWPSTIFTILIMGSANLLCTGILGLYLRAVLVEIRKRPNYLISTYVPAGVKTHSPASCRVQHAASSVI